MLYALEMKKLQKTDQIPPKLTPPALPSVLDPPLKNMRRSPSAGLMLGQRRRRWPNIKPALGLMFAVNKIEQANEFFFKYFSSQA